MMHRNNSNGRRAASERGYMALFAMLAMVAIAGGSASAAPTETVLYPFCSKPSCSDGERPWTGLTADSIGNLYGTTSRGGASDAGTVFKLSPGGTYTVLHSFKGGSDGAIPHAGLIADSSGNLYGTTEYGGASGCGLGGLGCGVVFKLSAGGTETVLYSFCSKPGCSDGANPYAGLIADSSGNLYGTAVNGGAAGDAAWDAAWCSSSRREGARRCSTPLRAAATGAIP